MNDDNGMDYDVDQVATQQYDHFPQQNESEQNNTILIQQSQIDDNDQLEVDENRNNEILKPLYTAIKASDMPTAKQFRRIQIPQHRRTPMRNEWLQICAPIVQFLNLQIRYNTKTNCVELKTSQHTEDVGALQKAADFIKALVMGFSVDDAMALLRMEDLYIDSFQVEDVKYLKGDHLSRAIGRVSGRDGRAKFTIENVTRTRIVVADRNIHILGSPTNIKLARDAICDLIIGSPINKIYARMQALSGRVNAF